jgi:hypothetical protein
MDKTAHVILKDWTPDIQLNAQEDYGFPMKPNSGMDNDGHPFIVEHTPKGHIIHLGPNGAYHHQIEEAADPNAERMQHDPDNPNLTYGWVDSGNRVNFVDENRPSIWHGETARALENHLQRPLQLGYPYQDPTPSERTNDWQLGDADHTGTSPLVYAAAQMYYHAAPIEARESIQQHGLLLNPPTVNSPWRTRRAIYMHQSLDEALRHGRRGEAFGGYDPTDEDIWEVNAPQVERDEFSNGVRTFTDVHPSQLRLHTPGTQPQSTWGNGPQTLSNRVNVLSTHPPSSHSHAHATHTRTPMADKLRQYLGNTTTGWSITPDTSASSTQANKVHSAPGAELSAPQVGDAYADRFKGVQLREDEDGWYVGTRGRSKSYPSPEDIPDSVVQKIRAQGSKPSVLGMRAPLFGHKRASSAERWAFEEAVSINRSPDGTESQDSYYHVAPASAREAIRARGLMIPETPRWEGSQPAVYLWKGLPHAQYYSTLLGDEPEGADIWRVNTEPYAHLLEADPSADQAPGSAWRLNQAVHPHWLELAEHHRDYSHDTGRYETQERYGNRSPMGSRTAGPNSYYHVAPADARDSFQTHGPRLNDPSKNPAWEGFGGVHGDGSGFYVWNSLPVAQQYQERLSELRGKPHDIWEVKAPAGWFDEDPEIYYKDAEKEYGPGAQSLMYSGDQPLTDYRLMQEHLGSGESQGSLAEGVPMGTRQGNAFDPRRVRMSAFAPGDRLILNDIDHDTGEPGRNHGKEVIYRAPDPNFAGSHYVQIPGQSHESWVTDRMLGQLPKYYHLAPTHERARIQAHGLKAGDPSFRTEWLRDDPHAANIPGVYVTHTPQHADDLADLFPNEFGHNGWDIWEVQHPRSPIQDPDSAHFVFPHDIEPQHLSMHMPWEENPGNPDIPSERPMRGLDPAQGELDALEQNKRQWGIGYPKPPVRSPLIGSTKVAMPPPEYPDAYIPTLMDQTGQIHHGVEGESHAAMMIRTGIRPDGKGLKPVNMGYREVWPEGHGPVRWYKKPMLLKPPENVFNTDRKWPPKNDWRFNLQPDFEGQEDLDRDADLERLFSEPLDEDMFIGDDEHYGKTGMAADPEWLNEYIKEHGPIAYHMTRDEDAARAIAQTGLLPWDHPNHPWADRGGHTQVPELAPRPNHVYMSLTPPHNHTLDMPHRNVLEIDLRKLHPQDLNPDEDIMDQPEGYEAMGVYPDEDPYVTWEEKGHAPAHGYEDRGSWFNSLPQAEEPWATQWSAESGTLAHRGPIPPEAIRYPYAEHMAEHPELYTARIAAEAPFGLMEWRPGRRGKGLVTPSGMVYTWNVNAQDAPHHMDAVQRGRIPMRQWEGATLFAIAPSGQLDLFPQHHHPSVITNEVPGTWVPEAEPISNYDNEWDYAA